MKNKGQIRLRVDVPNTHPWSDLFAYANRSSNSCTHLSSDPNSVLFNNKIYVPHPETQRTQTYHFQAVKKLFRLPRMYLLPIVEIWLGRLPVFGGAT